jgi:hypothetical protein
MSKWEAIDLLAVSGTSQNITKRERITGVVEIIPAPVKGSDRAWVLRPVEYLQADKVCGTVDQSRLDSDDPMAQRNAEKEATARRERLICSNAGFRIRHIVGLTKREAAKAFTAKTGDILILKRYGWGETFTYALRRID